MVTKTYLKPTYLPTYLCDSSDSWDSSDSSDSCDSSDSSDRITFFSSSHFEFLGEKVFGGKKFFFEKVFWSLLSLLSLLSLMSLLSLLSQLLQLSLLSHR